MRNKIMMMALLCALLVGLVPPSSARADNETKVVPAGRYEFAEVLVGWELFEVPSMKYELPNVCLYKCSRNTYFSVLASLETVYINGNSAEYSNGSWTKKGLSHDYGENITRYFDLTADTVVPSFFYEWLCLNVVDENGIPLGADDYGFSSWCADAGLNYAPSSNDLGLIKYGYERYMHIVRRTGLDKYGRWILTTIGNSVYADNTEDFTVMVDENGQLGVYCLYSGEEEGGYQLFVRNYVYDTDGWRLMSYELFDVREDDDCIIELGEDSLINDYSLLAYSNVDIYSSSLNLTYPASTEFVDVNDVLPDVPEQPEEPSVTPTVAPLPTVVPPITAGQATVTKNRTAIYEEPSSTSQVQHYLFEGGVVYVVEEYGEDWYYVRYDMGGLSYTGYIAQDNVNYDVENGFASEDVIDGYEGQVDDLLGMVGNVPKMIYALFSFLPPWCLALVGVSFSAMLALIGWKILRG